MCSHESETALCFPVLASLPPHSMTTEFFVVPLFHWFNTNLLYPPLDSYNNIVWPVFFAVSVWHLWTRRNKAIFKPQGPVPWPIQPLNPLSFLTSFCQEIMGNILYPKSPIQSRDYGLIAWSPSSGGTVKLNKDGCSNGNPDLAGA